MMDRSHCRSCGAEIIWCRTPAGKAIPIDPGPVDGGNVTVSQDLFGGWIATVVGHGQGDHVAHFATCPHANDWRKR
jgi:hypothetical protein